MTPDLANLFSGEYATTVTAELETLQLLQHELRVVFYYTRVVKRRIPIGVAYCVIDGWTQEFTIPASIVPAYWQQHLKEYDESVR